MQGETASALAEIFKVELPAGLTGCPSAGGA
jgi:hypothetical protein